jgi:predicted metal-dependent hydrolase
MRHAKLDEFIRLFNEGHFFEAHEILEELWLVSHGEQKTFYQGLIQCAVALAHWKKDNLRGAHQVGKRSFSILERFGDTRETIRIAELISDCESFFASKEDKLPRIKTTSD